MPLSFDPRADEPSLRAEAWKPSGIVALLTDFGSHDPYVGTLKGVILSRFPAAILVDLAHGVPRQDITTGAFFLSRSLDYFPPGSVFVAVVDPGVGTSRRLLVARDQGRAFLAPDNGLLAPALSKEAIVLELCAERFALPGASRTFHGRDILAPAAAAIASGDSPESAGRPLSTPIVALAIPRARKIAEDRVDAEVLFADRFGNLVLSAVESDLAGGPARWRIEAGGREIALCGTYAEVRSGDALGLVDSFGSIEIAVRDGNAAAELGLGRGSRLTLRKRT